MPQPRRWGCQQFAVAPGTVVYSMSLLSAGAQRVMDRLASQDLYTALDLLDALWVDESRAHEILRSAGFAGDSLARAQSYPELASCEWPLSDFLRSAQRHSTLEGRFEEVRTEHLLAAALEIETFHGLLQFLEIDALALKRQLHQPLVVATTPLTSDIQLRTTTITSMESMSVYRILDASANRCREGLRVVEDYARMILNDAHLTGQIKELRHALPPLFSRLKLDQAIRARDVAHDVGTSIHTAFEMARPSAWSVALANLKRVQESLRTLEEFGKTVDVQSAAAIGQLRYRFYGIESALCTTQESSSGRLQGCLLYLLVTDGLCDRGAGPVVKAALRGGVDIVQLREKEMPDGRLLELAKRLREWTAEADALFIINDRPDLACLVQADGVHVGQGDLPALQARQIVGGQRLVGVSTHSLAQASQAVRDGADYLGVGPVFSSHTKSFTEFAGLEYVEQVSREISLPSFAIGGIGLGNLEPVLAAGARRIAVSSEICQAEDPERATSQLKQALLLIQQAEGGSAESLSSRTSNTRSAAESLGIE